MSETSPVPEEESALHLERGGQLPAAGDQQDTGAGDTLPSDPTEAVAYLVDELGLARQQADSYLGDLQRVAADFENYRKRVQRDRDEIVTRSTQGLVAELLPVLDSFDGALSAAAGDDPLLAGLRSTHQLLVDVLSREGLEPIEALGMPFDPSLHEAVSGGGTGHLVVTAEMRRGYLLRGRVLRPSLVAVAVDDAGDGDTQ